MRVNFGRFLDVGGVLSQKQKQLHSAQASASNASVREHQHTNGTVRTRSDFHGEQAARNLHEALGRGHVDTATVVDVLATHSNRQRQHLRRHYRDLKTDVSEKLGGYVREISLMLLQTPAEFLATQVHCALQKIMPDMNTLIELLWGRSNDKLDQIKMAYQTAFGRPLEEEVRRELPGDVRPLAEALVAGQRAPPAVDVDLLLVSSGVGLRYGTEEPALLQMFKTRSYPHLQEVLEQYDMLSERSMEASIKAEFTGRLQRGLVSLASMIRDPVFYFSEQLHKAMEVLPPNDEKLIVLLIARSEIDLADIKDCYLQHYGHKLVGMVADVSSGAYRRYLLRLLGNYDE
ncbi:Annexin B10 [Gryllus bimaculatus]|nr:Annexin B10 [Gryllus bimaculatus]